MELSTKHGMAPTRHLFLSTVELCRQSYLENKITLFVWNTFIDYDRFVCTDNI